MSSTLSASTGSAIIYINVVIVIPQLKDNNSKASKSFSASSLTSQHKRMHRQCDSTIQHVLTCPSKALSTTRSRDMISYEFHLSQHSEPNQFSSPFTRPNSKRTMYRSDLITKPPQGNEMRDTGQFPTFITRRIICVVLKSSYCRRINSDIWLIEYQNFRKPKLTCHNLRINVFPGTSVVKSSLKY